MFHMKHKRGLRMARDFVVGTIAIVLAMVFVLLMIAVANAHDWYPPECCHNQDCAPVDSVETLPATTANMNLLWPRENLISITRVTTKHGTAIIPPGMPRRESPDGRMHACMHNGRLLCVFWPPNS